MGTFELRKRPGGVRFHENPRGMKGGVVSPTHSGPLGGLVV